MTNELLSKRRNEMDFSHSSIAAPKTQLLIFLSHRDVLLNTYQVTFGRDHCII